MTLYQKFIFVLFTILAMCLAPLIAGWRLIAPIVQHIIGSIWSGLMYPHYVQQNMKVAWGLMEDPEAERKAKIREWLEEIEKEASEKNKN